MYNQSNECCKYRERKLVRKKKNKPEKKKLSKNEDCQEVENFETKRTKCLNKKEKKVAEVQSSKFNSKMNDLLSRIKPSFSERKKYFNPHHVFCFLEGMKNTNLKQQNIIYTIAGSKSCLGTSGKSKGMQKKPTQAVKCDSICSIDSVVDLAGLALTREEKEEISKNLKKRKKENQKGQKEESEGEEDEGHELVEKKAPEVEEEREEEKEKEVEVEEEVEKEEEQVTEE